MIKHLQNLDNFEKAVICEMINRTGLCKNEADFDTLPAFRNDAVIEILKTKKADFIKKEHLDVVENIIKKLTSN